MTTLPAVVTIADLTPIPSTAISGGIIFECVATVGNQGNSYQIALNQVATVAFGTLPTGGGTGQILNKIDASNFSAQWSGITQFVAVGTGLATSGTATSIVASLATQTGLSVLGVTGSGTLAPAAIIGAAAQVLRVNDAGNTLAFGAINLASAAAVTGTLPSANMTAVNLATSGAGGVQGVLPVPNGGTNTSTLTATGILFGNGSSTVGITAAGNTSIPLLGQGVGNSPAFGVLPVIGGGTNTTTLTAFGALYGNGTSTVGITAAGTTNWPLIANGTAVAPAFAQINLGSSGITGALGLANGGTGATTADTARTSLFAAPFDAMQYFGFQINEGHEISQRIGDSVATTNASAAGVGYNLTDGNRCFVQGSFGMTFQRVTDAPPGFSYSLKGTIISAQAALATTDAVHRFQVIEGWRVQRLAFGSVNAAPISIGWWVKPSLTNQVVNLTIANAFAENRNYVTKWTLTANTWNFISTTIPGDTAGTWLTNGTGSLIALLVLGAGSSYFGPVNQWNTTSLLDASSDVTNMAASTSATFQDVGPFIYMGSQIPASTTTPNLVRFFTDNLALSQRYYQKSFNMTTLPAQNVGTNTGEYSFGAIQNGALTQKSNPILFLPTRMRTTPTITLYSPATTSGEVYDKTAGTTCSGSATSGQSGSTYFFVACTGNALTSTGNTLVFHWDADARL